MKTLPKEEIDEKPIPVSDKLDLLQMMNDAKPVIEALIETNPDLNVSYRAPEWSDDTFNYMMTTKLGILFLRADIKRQAAIFFVIAEKCAKTEEEHLINNFFVNYILDSYTEAFSIYKRIHDFKPFTLDIKLTAIKLMKLIDEYPFALKTVNELLDEFPDRGSLWLQRSSIHTKLGQSEEANNDLIKYLPYCPQDKLSSAQYLIGLYKFSQQKHLDAIQWFTKSIKSNDSFADAYHFRGYCRMLLNEYDDAIPDLEKAMQLGYSVEDTMEVLGPILIFMGKYDEARHRYESILEFNKDSVIYHFGIGSTYLAEQNSKKAREEFNECLRIDSNEPLFYLQMAMIDAIERDFAAATKNVALAEEKDADIASTEFTKGQIELLRFNPTASIRHLLNANMQGAQSPPKFLSHLMIGLSKAMINDSSSADDLAIAQIHAPTQFLGNMTSILSYTLKNKFIEAGLILTKMIDQLGGRKLLHLLRGMFRYQEGNYHGSITDILKEISISGPTYELNLALAECYYAMRKYKDASKSTNVAIGLKDTEAAPYLLLGKIEYHWNKHDRGKKYFERALEINNNLGEAHYYLGLIERDKENPKGAIVRFEKAAELGYTKASTELVDMNSPAAKGERGPMKLNLLGDSNHPNILRHEADHWRVRFDGGEIFTMMDLKGLTYIAMLVAKPGETLYANQMVADTLEDVEIESEKPEPTEDEEERQQRLGVSKSKRPSLNPATLKEYENALESLKRELENSIEIEEKEELEMKIKKVRSLIIEGKHPEINPDDLKNSNSVRNAIHRAIEKLQDRDKDMAAHLQDTITCGLTVTYQPSPNRQWST